MRFWDFHNDPPTRVNLGAKIQDDILIEAIAASSTIGSSEITYEIYASDDTLITTVTRHLNCANAQLLSDFNYDNAITLLDRVTATNPVPRNGWVIPRRAEPYLLRAQNESPSDADPLLVLSGNGNVAISGGDSPLALTLDPPVAIARTTVARDTSTDLWLDASSGAAEITVTHLLISQDPLPFAVFTGSVQHITILDTRIPERWERPDAKADITYDLPGNVSWDVTPSQGGAPVASDTKPPLSFSANLALGDYTVQAHFLDLWHPTNGSPQNFNPTNSAPLHIVDTRIDKPEYILPAGSVQVISIPLDMTRSKNSASWRIEPNLPGGARIFAGANPAPTTPGVLALDAMTNVWVRPGVIATNYTLTTNHPFNTNMGSVTL